MMETANGIIRSSVSFANFSDICKTFEALPFFEKWSAEEIEEGYNSFLSDGFIFRYFTKDDKCIGIFTMKPYEACKQSEKFPNSIKVVCLSSVATFFEYQYGYSMSSFEIEKRNLNVLEYEYIYLKTKEESFLSYAITRKRGFIQIFDTIYETK